MIWGSLADGSEPVSWEDAAENRLAAGVEARRDGAVLHTCALGLQDVYVRRVDDAIYFATRIEPLLHIVPGRVNPDPVAWASIITLGFPAWDATPFLEVRRLAPATAWRAHGSSITPLSFEPDYLDAEPNGRIVPADMTERVAAHLPPPRKLSRTNWTLSGGWDSRLLAGLAARSGGSRTAWTTSPDDGRDSDIALSRPVAAALGMRHHVVEPGPEAWVEHVDQMRERSEYQTWMHTWLVPLANKLHHVRGPVIDGLGGDVLLKSLFVDADVAAAEAPEQVRAGLWRSLSRGRVTLPGMLAEESATAIEGTARAAFNAAISYLDGHGAAPALAVLLTRTARGVASSPLHLFAPECDVRVPFMHPEVVETALRVPVESKLDGGYYRQMLYVAAGDRVAGLPSTNDPGPKPPIGHRRAATEKAVALMAEAIYSDNDVARHVGPRLAELLTSEGRTKLQSRSGALALLHALTTLAVWRQRYAAVLTSAPPLPTV